MRLLINRRWRRGQLVTLSTSFLISQWLRAGARAGAHTSYADIAL
jgi:hypothetical protein